LIEISDFTEAKIKNLKFLFSPQFFLWANFLLGIKSTSLKEPSGPWLRSTGLIVTARDAWLLLNGHWVSTLVEKGLRRQVEAAEIRKLWKGVYWNDIANNNHCCKTTAVWWNQNHCCL